MAILQKVLIEKAIERLIQPIDESISLLRKIDAKLDSQAKGKLKGALNSIQNISSAGMHDEITLKIALSSLTESSAYFEFQIKQTALEGKKLLARIVRLTASISLLWEFARLGKGRVERFWTFLIEYLSLFNLLTLSEIGQIVCMKELNYSKKHMETKWQNHREGVGDLWTSGTSLFEEAVTGDIKQGFFMLLGMSAFCKAWRKQLLPQNIVSWADERLLKDGVNLNSWLGKILINLISRPVPMSNENLFDLLQASVRLFSIWDEIVNSKGVDSFLKSFAKRDLPKLVENENSKSAKQ